MSRWPPLAAAVVALTLVSCGQVEPLATPIPADRVSPAGARVVLSNAHLQGVAAAVRLRFGKTHEVSVAPLEVGEAGSVAATTIGVAVGPGSVGIDADGGLQIAVALTVTPQPLVLQGAGAACSATWAASGLSLGVDLRFARDPLGTVTVHLAAPPSLQLDAATLEDDGGCFAAAGATATAAILAHVREAVRGGLGPKLTDAARDVVATVLPPGWEFALQTTSAGATLHGDARYQPVGASGLVAHNGAYLQAALDVGLDAPRHACAVDAAPPSAGPWLLPAQVPLEPAGASVLRRSVVLGGGALARLGWALHRGGWLCRGASTGLEARLGPDWATKIAPSLGALVQPGSVSARFWPGGAPTLRVLDGDGAADLEWVLPDALVEVAAPVDGVELAVLRVAGSLRMRVRLRGVGDAWSLETSAVELESVGVDSPLVPLGTVSPTVLLPLLRAVLGGIFDGPLALPPGSPALVGTRRVGDALWMWIDGGVQQP
ncbi:MAG: hypothetical protein RIT45_2897 [Pseudomonadota bacterium]|jgi:hypothetical protein